MRQRRSLCRIWRTKLLLSSLRNVPFPERTHLLFRSFKKSERKLRTTCKMLKSVDPKFWTLIRLLKWRILQDPFSQMFPSVSTKWYIKFRKLASSCWGKREGERREASANTSQFLLTCLSAYFTLWGQVHTDSQQIKLGLSRFIDWIE